MTITLTIDATDVIQETECSEREAKAFLVSRSAQLKCDVEGYIGEAIGEMFPTWHADHRESLRDAAADAKLHARREGEAA